MTTVTGIFCPKCKKEIEIKTQGLLGGILSQFFVHSIIDFAKKEGGSIICPCGHKFRI